MSDEEDDLESLRLAALQTLKKPTTAAPSNNFVASNGSHPPMPMRMQMAGGSPARRGRGFYTGNIRGGRNGQFNNFNTRQHTLIAIPTTNQDVTHEKAPAIKPPPKLILPQDRYCSKKLYDEEEKVRKETSSKFSRYDDSDSDEESEEESEPELSEDEDGVKVRLRKTDSLEELMMALDNEIKGGEKVDEVVIRKKRKKSKQESSGESDAVIAVEIVNRVDFGSEENVDVKFPSQVELRKAEGYKSNEENLQRTGFNSNDENERAAINTKKLNFKRSGSHEDTRNSTKCYDKENRHFERRPIIDDIDRRGYAVNDYDRLVRDDNSVNFRRRLPMNGQRRPPAKQFLNHPPFIDPPPQIYNVQPYNRLPPYPPPPMNNYTPPHVPLALNLPPDPLGPMTMAPLSPRSAAFVMQNQEIIDRRKKSPRKSYSRSPSPRFRRTRSRSRSLTPPPRRSPVVTRRPPPRSPKRSPLPPRRRSKSPVKEVQKTSVKVRLGVPTDPVLEARKRKFEEESVPKEGIIRLKLNVKPPEESTRTVIPPKSPEKPPSPPSTPSAKEEQDDDLLDIDATTLFSDSDSESENEARFKSTAATTTTTKPAVIHFQALVNGAKPELKAKPLDQIMRDQNRRRTSRDRRRPKRACSASRSSPSKRKRERTPRKAEKSGGRKCEKREKEAAKRKEGRRVEKVAKEAEGSNENGERVSNVADEERDIVKKSDAGDLRAQLSRKRAERQNASAPVSSSASSKPSITAEDVQSRLLHNALQGAVFSKKLPSPAKKSSSSSSASSKRRKEKEAAPKEKIPIHLRLGTTADVSSEKSSTEAPPPRKKKRGNRGRSSEQAQNSGDIRNGSNQFLLKG